MRRGNVSHPGAHSRQDVRSCAGTAQASGVDIAIHDCVLKIVNGIRHIIRKVHDLGLSGENPVPVSLPRPQEDFFVIGVGAKFFTPAGVAHRALNTPGVFHAGQQAGSGQIEAAGDPVGVQNFGLQSNKEPESLRVAFEPTAITGPFGKGFFTVMSKRGVTNVVGQTSRLYHVRVQAQPGGQFPPDLGNFERMGKPIPGKIQTLRGRKHLGFCCQTAQR